MQISITVASVHHVRGNRLPEVHARGSLRRFPPQQLIPGIGNRPLAGPPVIAVEMARSSPDTGSNQVHRPPHRAQLQRGIWRNGDARSGKPRTEVLPRSLVFIHVARTENLIQPTEHIASLSENNIAP